MNISSDKVHISDGQKENFLERNGIENILGPVLVKWYRDDPFDEILVLNGPGGFTNLRVGTLGVNLLNTLANNKIDIYNFSKIYLYNYLIQKGFLPKIGLIYLGQKKNVWKYDFEADKYEVVVFDKGWAVDGDDFFVDFVSDKEYRDNLNKNMVKFAIKGKKLEIGWKNKKIEVSKEDLELQKFKNIKAEYFIEAIN